MATYATGITATFNGTTLGELTEIGVVGGGSLPIARSHRFAVDAGTIDVKCFLASGIGPAAYGQKGTFAITGGGLAFTTKAILQTYRLEGKANDVARYAATLKIVME